MFLVQIVLFVEFTQFSASTDTLLILECVVVPISMQTAVLK